MQGRTGLARARLRRCALALGLMLAAERGHAAGAVGFNNWDGALPSETVQAGESASATGDGAGFGGLGSSMAGNPSLLGSAWAHTGDWWNLYLGASDSVSITVTARDAEQLSPGLAVWASGASVFDGGTTSFGEGPSYAGFGTPHSFNAYAALGSPGTLWMQQGQGGNMQEFLGYAISGPSYAGPTGWGETITHGAHGVVSSSYASAIGGSVAPGLAQLVLSDVQSGWYTIYVGGTDHSLAGGLFDLTVTSVPEPGTALLLGFGLAGLAASRRRRTG
jgi:hypothetical protein